MGGTTTEQSEEQSWLICVKSYTLLLLGNVK